MELYLDFFVLIGRTSLETWRVLLAVPSFARYSTTKEVRELATRLFTVKTEDICSGIVKYTLAGKLHRCHVSGSCPLNIKREKIVTSYEWWSHGIRHRHQDRPAVIREEKEEWAMTDDKIVQMKTDRRTSWWCQGVVHRSGMPKEPLFSMSPLSRSHGSSTEEAGGSKYWYVGNYLKGKRLHRGNDKPAYISYDGQQEWYDNGELHRKNGPPVVWPDGTSESR